MTGCLQRDSSATPGATGTSGTAGAATAKPSDSKFVLNVTPPSPSSSSTASSATAGTSGATSYRLDADDAKLTPHVGHKVEITGTVDKSASSTTGAAPSAPAGTMANNAPKLKVDSVRMIAASCTN